MFESLEDRKGLKAEYVACLEDFQLRVKKKKQWFIFDLKEI
jgi:hypothetical protein